MTEVWVSERSNQLTGEVGDGRSDAPMDIAIEMATAMSPIASDTNAGAATLHQMVRNENGMPRRRSEMPAITLVPGDYRSRMH
jgi:hypothetical protein